METLKLRDNFYWTGIVDDKLGYLISLCTRNLELPTTPM